MKVSSDVSSGLPIFDVTTIPFSVEGAWINLSTVTGLHQHADQVHLVSHVNGLHPVLRLAPLEGGSEISAQLAAEPGRLTWTHHGGQVEATFDNPTTVRLRGRSLPMAFADASPGLTPFSGTYLVNDPFSAAYVFTSYETGRRYRLTALQGELTADGVESLGVARRAVTAKATPGGAGWELAIEELTSEADPYTPDRDFDAAVASVQTRFHTYVDAVAPWRGAHRPAAELACYVLWSATVAPAGFIRRPAILMSKHWMDKVWSWDHCFNAIALASGEPALAWDQFLTPFDHQDERGALPDSVTHSEVLFNYVKPPIHGWALTEIRRRASTPLDADQLHLAYRLLARWTRFWLDHRRRPGRRLPYYQHGNDSGWDNATTFDRDRLIESPDLAGFLIVQLQVLADLSDELDLTDGSTWRDEASALLSALLDQRWDGEHFTAEGVTSGQASTATSLLNLLPLLLGEQLPEQVSTRLVSSVEAHLTPWGVATEPTPSPHYESDGYWRGPIWAPSTVLIESGLRRSGHHALADTVRQTFLALCDRSGFAENFDALTGEGLRDRAYTWTASAYLLLSEDASGDENAHGDVDADRIGLP